MLLLSSADFFPKNVMNTIGLSVRPDLSPSYLQMLSADDKSCSLQYVIPENERLGSVPSE